MRRYLLGASLLALLCGVASGAFAPTPTPVGPGGTKAVCDLPVSQHMRNKGGSDGAGLCVFTSVEHASRWQNVPELAGFQTWMTRRPGGGWPQKLDEMIAAYCRENGKAAPGYVQHTGGDVTFLEAALKTDRMPCVTYAGRDDFYRTRIAHMVNLAHLDASAAAIIDNNRPGLWVWMTRAEFLARWRDMQGGWAVVLMNSPPPPYPEAVAKAACPCGGNCGCDPCDCRPVVGQCPNGRCPIPAPAIPLARPSTPVTSPAPIGSPPSDRHEWGEIPGYGWGWRFKQVPELKPVLPPSPTNFGVDGGKIHAHPHYSINGVPVSKEIALSMLGAGPIADDSDRWHLTAVGDGEFLGRVTADVLALPADVRGKLHFQPYAPDSWPVGQFKLPAGVSLRKPSPVRTGGDVGAIPVAGYDAGKLAGLLALPGGPTYKPVPTPAPQPSPAPVPPPPFNPPGPGPLPAPPPPEPAPAPQPNNGGGGVPAWLVVLVGVVVYILARK